MKDDAVLIGRMKMQAVLDGDVDEVVGRETAIMGRFQIIGSVIVAVQPAARMK